ncbi:MAG: lipoprotein insertase outer membrane protein LolB [Pseudomonadota bacterium]
MRNTLIKKRFLGTLGALCCALMVAGCVGPEGLGIPPEAASAEARGKLGVRPADPALGPRPFSANFRWREDRRRFDFELWGPFGQGRVQIVGDARRVTVFDARGERVSGGDPEALLQNLLGWSVPLEVLPRWLRGQPADEPAFSGESRDADGRLTGFEQAGWQLQFDRYGRLPDRRPGRIRAANEQLRLTLFVREWAPAGG